MRNRRSRRRALPLAAAGCLLAALAVVAPSTARAGTSLCGSLRGSTPHITKVMWIFMENVSYGSGPTEIPGDRSASYIDSTLLRQCGSTTDYHAASHPSYPNYLAATSGSTHGATSDKMSYVSGPSIFSQVNPSWRSYEEFMPKNCDHYAQTGSPGTGFYVGRHNPAASYSSPPIGAPGADCTSYDEPLGTTTSGALLSDVQTGQLPKFSFVTPGLCDDMHTYPRGQSGCADPVATGDSWLKTWIPIITGGPDYTSGDLLIDVTWDEGQHGTYGKNCVTSNTVDCIVPDIVISPYTPHVVSKADFSHYSLLKTTEKILKVRYLGAAADASTKLMCSAFHICP
jgi:hypothetical protein